MIFNFFQFLGRGFFNILSSLGRSFLLLFYSLISMPDFFSISSRFIKQLYIIGVLSLLVIVLSGIFIGMVLSLQGYSILVKFGAEQMLGQMISLTLVRELSPVVVSLLFAGRAGSALTAEIGLMKATEQLSSMEMMGVDPLRRIIASRFWAGFISVPILSFIFSTVSIGGGYFVGVNWLNVDSAMFWSNIQCTVNFKFDIINSIIKSFIFGFIISWISIFQGVYCVPTSSGIGTATTNTVVYSSLSILAINFFLTTIMYLEV